MNCTVCGGPLGIDTLAGQEWLKCTRCGTWAGPRAQLAGAAVAGAAAPLPAALAPQPLAWGASPPAAPPGATAPAPAAPSPYQQAAPGAATPTPEQIAAAAAVLAQAGLLPQAGAVAQASALAQAQANVLAQARAKALGPARANAVAQVRALLPAGLLSQPGVLAHVEQLLGMGGSAPEPQLDVARVPPAPRTPSRLARKLIYSYQGSQKIKRILGVVFTLVGLAATLPATWNLPGEIALALSATPATAQVTSVERNPSVRMNRRTATRIEFTYTVAGERYTESVNTIEGRAISLARRANTPLPIEYATIYPGFARIQGCGYSFFGFAAVFFLIMPLVGFFLWFSAWRSNRREIRAFRHGTPVVASITARTYDTRVRQNGRSPRLIRWSFEVAGTEYHGDLSHMDEDVLDGALPGHQLIALHDPRNPAVNTAWLE